MVLILYWNFIIYKFTFLITGLLAKIFDNKFVVPLGRLSYSVFLVNLPVMMISQSSQRVPSYVSGKTLVKQKS